jgi:hypothetical protein
MQVVGRPCDVCERVVKNELEGVACERCQRVFHDACVKVESDATADTYRAPSPPKNDAKPKKVKAPRSTTCPTCGTDVRAVKRAADHANAKVRERFQAVRREHRESGDLATSMGQRLLVRIVVSLLFAAIAAIVGAMRHR